MRTFLLIQQPRISEMVNSADRCEKPGEVLPCTNSMTYLNRGGEIAFQQVVLILLVDKLSSEP